MNNDSVLLLVGLQCPPEIEQKFNEWYEEHISDILKYPGVKAATRYKLTEDNDEYPNYLAIYEFENEQAAKDYDTSPERDVVMRRAAEWWPEGTPYERRWRVKYRVIQSWKK
ncbi:DUF4286 family protein [Chloroflexota bacterium]